MRVSSDSRVVVVGNGSPVPDVPEGVKTVELPENLGIPGGRNVGIEAFGPGGRDVGGLLRLGPVLAQLFQWFVKERHA